MGSSTGEDGLSVWFGLRNPTGHHWQLRSSKSAGSSQEQGKPFKEGPENPRLDMEAGAKGLSKTQLDSSCLLVAELSFIASCCGFHSGQAFKGSDKPTGSFLKNSRLQAGP